MSRPGLMPPAPLITPATFLSYDSLLIISFPGHCGSRLTRWPGSGSRPADDPWISNCSERSLPPVISITGVVMRPSNTCTSP
jgi:hypothetical protein